MATLDLHARVHATTVVERREPAPGVVLLALDAPDLAACRASRANSSWRFRRAHNRQRRRSPSTKQKASTRAFSSLSQASARKSSQSCGRAIDSTSSGPLGNGFDCTGSERDVAIVAGGVGIASVWLCAQRTARARCARTSLLRRAHRRTARRSAAFRRCRLRVDLDDRRRIARRRRGFVTEALRASHRSPTRSLPAVRRRCCAASRESQRTSTFARSWRSKKPSAAASADAGDASFRSMRSSAQAPSFPPADRGGSDVVYARVCKEGPVFWADELRW